MNNDYMRLLRSLAYLQAEEPMHYERIVKMVKDYQDEHIKAISNSDNTNNIFRSQGAYALTKAMLELMDKPTERIREHEQFAQEE